MFTLILIIHILVSVLLVVLILLQQSKGGMSEMFGGSQENILSGFGAENFLTKTTAILAVVFMITSFSLAIMTSKSNRTQPIRIENKIPVQNEVPQNAPEQNSPQQNPTLPLNNLPTNEGGK